MKQHRSFAVARVAMRQPLGPDLRRRKADNAEEQHVGEVISVYHCASLDLGGHPKQTKVAPCPGAEPQLAILAEEPEAFVLYVA